MWSVVIFMILVLAAMMAGCRDLLSSKVLKSNDHPKQDVNKKFYIPPMVIVVGLLCFIMYASEGAVMGWSAILLVKSVALTCPWPDFLYRFCHSNDYYETLRRQDRRSIWTKDCD